jgi:hypothetical protein
VDLLRTLNIYHPALADGVCPTLHPYLEVILCRGDRASDTPTAAGKLESSAITPPGLPGISSTPPLSGGGFGTGIEPGTHSVRSASDRDG